MSTYDFAGRTAIVTGGASGMGGAAARALAASGARVVIADVSDDLGQQIVSEINDGAGEEARFVRTDVRNEAEVEALVTAALGEHEGLDFFINAAGVINAREPIDELTEAELDRVFGVNFKGAFFGMKHAIPALRRNSGGVIVNFASVQGYRVLHKGAAFYAASKAALISLTKSGAMEYGSEGIRVVAIAPGPIDTPMLRSVTGNVWPPRIVEDTPLGRLGESEEVAEAVLWLCSDGASYVSGATLPVDGAFLSV